MRKILLPQRHLGVHNAGMSNYLSKAAGYLLAIWHLRQAPLVDASGLERARWCRDHCGQFAARWFAFGAALWLLFTTPFVSSPVFAFLGVFGLVMGMWHIAWQILAQKKAGLPPIDKPVDFPRDDD